MLDTWSRREMLSGAGAVALCAGHAVAGEAAAPAPAWRKLPTEHYRGKQDDVFFVNRDTGWYGNGLGRIFATRDGGATWTKQLDQPGTYVRALGFVDERIGVFGNIGPGSFPGVTDPQPLYRTTDGGATWAAVTSIDGPRPSGICAIDVARMPFVNAGVLDRRVVIRAGGRVGGPAFLLESRDLGATWTSRDMNAHTAMILDVNFLDDRVGFIAGATDANVQESHALVLKTSDGGRSWRKVYQSSRPWEITWKLGFPTRRVGFVTVQNYDPDTGNIRRIVGRTTDGGESWHELPVLDEHAFNEFGIAFLDAKRGWIGGSTTGVETADGGRTWRTAEMGRAVNKIRIVRDASGTALFAIGSDLYRLDLSG